MAQVPQSPLTLYQAKTSYFCAGFEVDINGIIRNAAPIIKWVVGKPLSFFRWWVTMKSGSIVEVPYE